MNVEKLRRGDVVILALSGDFDSAAVPEVTEVFDQILAAEENRLVLDLARLDFIDSSALGTLIKTSKLIGAAKGEMVLARPSRFVSRTLGTLGLDDYFRVFDDVEGAVARFGG